MTGALPARPRFSASRCTSEEHKLFGVKRSKFTPQPPFARTTVFSRGVSLRAIANSQRLGLIHTTWSAQAQEIFSDIHIRNRFNPRVVSRRKPSNEYTMLSTPAMRAATLAKSPALGVAA